MDLVTALLAVVGLITLVLGAVGTGVLLYWKSM